jgi:nitrite reductase/ring-hydroxylating ferredoxin subunit
MSGAWQRGGRVTNWVANGLSKDVVAGVVVPGRWQGVDLAIWRSALGVLRAWKDRCPHRGMRLSHGFVRGEGLSCIYHGWTYGTDGGCRSIPAHPDLVPPAAIRAEALACAEGGGVIWVAAAGEASPLPDLAGLRPLRSLAMVASPAQIAAALPRLRPGSGGLRGTVTTGGAEATLCLLLQDAADGQTMVHALCGPQDDPVAVSRWLEGLRRGVEERVAA